MTRLKSNSQAPETALFNVKGLSHNNAKVTCRGAAESQGTRAGIANATFPPRSMPPSPLVRFKHPLGFEVVLPLDRISGSNDCLRHRPKLGRSFLTKQLTGASRTDPSVD